jgi:hypothetical protein
MRAGRTNDSPRRVVKHQLRPGHFKSQGESRENENASVAVAIGSDGRCGLPVQPAVGGGGHANGGGTVAGPRRSPHLVHGYQLRMLRSDVLKRLRL